MKKIVLFTLALAFAVTSVNAQNWIVGGSVAAHYSKTKDVDNDITAFSVIPSIHYMFNSNWAVGTGIGYTWMEQKNGTNPSSKLSAFVARPSLIYFKELGKGFYYTPELFVDLKFGKELGVKYTSFGGGVSPLSFEFRPTNCIGITFAAGDLSFTSSKPKGGKSTSTLNFELNTGAAVGFRFYF